MPLPLAPPPDPTQTLILTIAAQAFERLSGYTLNEVVGHNCRFMQGEATEKAAIKAMVAALRTGEPCDVHGECGFSGR